MSLFSILVAEDDAKIRTLLKRYLLQHGFLVSEVSTIEEERLALQRFRFDVIIQDISFPDGSGHSILELGIQTPIIVVSALGEVDDRLKGLELGAFDYLTKPFEPKELLIKIQRLLSISAPIPQIIKMQKGAYNIELGQITTTDDVIVLTSQEKRLMKYLISKKGKPVSREEISQELGGMASGAIDTLINRLRIKVEINPKRPMHLITERNIGYMLHI